MAAMAERAEAMAPAGAHDAPGAQNLPAVEVRTAVMVAGQVAGAAAAMRAGGVRM